MKRPPAKIRRSAGGISLLAFALVLPLDQLTAQDAPADNLPALPDPVAPPDLGDPAEPAEPADSTEPTEPADSTEPTEPAEPVGSAEPMDEDDPIIGLDPGLLPPPDALPEPPPGDGLAPPPATDPAVDAAFAGAVSRAAMAGTGDITFGGKGVTLEEALRVTLALQPTIELAVQDMEIAQAALKGFLAPFDHIAYLELNHGRSYTANPDSNIIAQRTGRQALIDLREEIKEVRRGNSDGGDIRISRIDESGREQTDRVDLSSLDPRIISSQETALLNQLQRQAAALEAAGFGGFNSREIAQGIKDGNRARARALRDLERDLKTAISEFSIQETTRSGTSDYEIGMNKLYRSGIFVNPKLRWNKAGVSNTASAEIDFTVPLLRGRGAVQERALEEAGQFDLDAAEWELRHKISSSLAQTAQAFWNCVAAQRNLNLRMTAENISLTFVTLTDLRIEAGEIAEGEAAQARASYAQAQGTAIDAEFALLDARRQLAFAMGLSYEELIEPPYAIGELPFPADVSPVSPANFGALASRSREFRADRRAAFLRMRSGKVLTDAAIFDLKPRVDFFFSLAMSAIDDGSHFQNHFSPFTDRKVGPSIKGGLSMDWPLENNLRESEVMRNRAFYRQSAISLKEVDRLVDNGVMLAAEEVSSTHRQVGVLRQASNYSADALGAEQARFSGGDASLLDALILQQTFIESVGAVIQAQLRHAAAISRLRFESGTLLDPSREFLPANVSFSPANVATLPRIESLPAPDYAAGEVIPEERANVPLIRRLDPLSNSNATGIPMPDPRPEVRAADFRSDGPLPPVETTAPRPLLQRGSSPSAAADAASPAPYAPADEAPSAQSSPPQTTQDEAPKPLMQRIFGR